jgi:hypothetical protein
MYATEEKADQMIIEFLAARLDKRFDCAIKHMEVDHINNYFYDRELDKRFTLTKRV